ncbi:threonine synthase [Aridibaculum aurantiacum]|uniref:threonine synthase n=1 Tax=Aridibaculum aurantiacum TaxID=2810307 RepID=UPI001A96604F|nr:threonine synthase [Aridibaculum aurantiacum]
MHYYSTSQQSPFVDFKEATIKGQAPDKGLFFPEHIPTLPPGFINNIKKLSKEEIALTVIQPYVGDTIPKEKLEAIVAETINFNIPVVPVTDNIYSLELYHGPTFAFKDVGGRFMSRCLGHFVKDHDKEVTVLVATSGDTGGAVASGFYNVEGVNVVILYPSGKVSSVQELQLTTLGKNITAIEVDGTFDDCQQMVKQAFTDAELNKKLFLTSANSINVARWLPQQFYYFFSYQQWHQEQPPVISVPSGNFGNICAGLLAYRSGLPVKHFIAACNANDVVPQFLQNGKYTPQPAVPTLSNAMDVGSPSNFIRIMELFQHDLQQLQQILSSVSISDAETTATVKQIFTDHNYLLDPHGAVAYAALEKYLQKHQDEKGILLETAHPIKFYDVVEPMIDQKIAVPASIEAILQKEKQRVKMEADYTFLKDFLLQ